jgi:hypothetical protein
MAADGTCSALALELGEPLAGTAGETLAWLLVEQPGPWGRFAFRESRLDPAIGAALEDCTGAGVNALLVKRPGRDDARRRRRVFLASSHPGNVWAASLELDDPRALLDLDLEALGRGERPAGADHVEHPLFLVCTNGRRDACCARLGRPAAAAVRAAFPAETWECSHTGGHRFASVMLCLPDGLVYGRLDPDAAVRAAFAYAAGRIEPEAFRGRTALAGPAQAADAYVRAREGIAGIDELTVEAVRDGEVVLARRGGPRYVVRLRQEPAEPPRPTSCRDLGTEGKRPPVWTLESVELV